MVDLGLDQLLFCLDQSFVVRRVIDFYLQNLCRQRGDRSGDLERYGAYLLEFARLVDADIHQRAVIEEQRRPSIGKERAFDAYDQAWRLVLKSDYFGGCKHPLCRTNLAARRRCALKS